MFELDLGELETIFVAVSLIAILLIVGLWLRYRSRTLSRLFLPGSVVAGVVALLLGGDVGGAVLGHIVGDSSRYADGLFGAEITSVWRALPSLLINFVFASLFIGKSIPGVRQIWRQAGPVVCYGQSIAWGQYMVGLLLVLFVLTPFFGLPPMAAALIEISFEGGHGTAAGLAPVFEDLGYAEGVDLALGLASVGLISAIVSGVILISWAHRRGHLTASKRIEAEAISAESSALLEAQDGTARKTSLDTPIDPMSFHLGLIAASIFIGWILLEVLVFVESKTWGARGLNLFVYVPLFPLAMVGGAIVQLALQRLGIAGMIDRDLINRISGLMLDVIIVAALATLSLTVIADNFAPFLLLAVAGMAWNIVGFLVLAPRLIATDWFETGIPNFGQSMGMTVTGILLFQMADPRNHSGGLEKFGYKQLLFEPVVGGGIFTASALPLIFELGPWVVFVITSSFFVLWIGLGFLLRRRASA